MHSDILRVSKRWFSLVKSNSKIRCAGALHSCAPLIESEGIIMSMTKLDKVVKIDSEKMTVRCQVGARIYYPLLKKIWHLVLYWQTIAGAVMTGTHGGALTLLSLHTFVNLYTYVKADGEIESVFKDANPTLFSAMDPSMCVLGTVVELELLELSEMEIQCGPFQILEAQMEVIKLDDLIDTIENIMELDKYMGVVVYPNINKATICRANSVSLHDEAIARGAATSGVGYTNFRNEKEKAMLEKYLFYCNSGKFEPANLLLNDSHMARPCHYVGDYNHVLQRHTPC